MPRTAPFAPARRRLRGGALPFLLLLIGAGLTLAAYTTEGARLKSSAAQLKHATDAAAMAVTQAYAGDSGTDVQALAEKYVRANLGMDAIQLENGLDVALERVTRDDAKGFRVSATFRAEASMLGPGADVTVSSAAVALSKSLEVALALPNTGAENSSNLAVLRRLGKQFAENLVAGRNNAWLALVPYSQAVNVSPDYTNPTTRSPRGPSADHRQRLTQWAMSSALRPVELTSLFRTGYSGLHDARIPDRRANLLCMYRGLYRGENYFWDAAPSGQFRIYYRHDLPVNGSPGADPISWVGPNPDFGQATGVNDTRSMVADKGCPSAPLLPLTNDLDKIEERLEQMSTRFNVNYAIAMGWSAMALAPAFRGAAGWNLEDDLPRDFDDDGGDTVKAIILLGNTTDQRWFDSDSYNAYVGEAVQGCEELGCVHDSVITQRFANLCKSFQARKLRFFLIVVGQDEIENNDLGAEGTVDGASEFRRIAGPGLEGCAEKSADLTYLSGYDFVAAEGRIQSRLDNIADELRQKSNFIRLIE
ncbi:pilus assembly protein [Pseudothauera nasutitermitis]|uniref:pilus assembly protein n=1 Tax=Pseudothauera nasutitermitis TaxID=2565930 RepID=UPI001B3B2141|nr:pilus assembly protein [Pseudothauera nasutitermitis]